MNGGRARLGWLHGAALLLSGVLLAGCGSTDKGVGVTADRDFTLVLQVPDRFLRIGDQAPITVRLKRTDNSNLGRGLQGRIYLSLSAHGSVNTPVLEFAVADDTTREIIDTVVFTADTPGLAEVRASYLDATARIELVISSLSP